MFFFVIALIGSTLDSSKYFFYIFYQTQNFLTKKIFTLITGQSRWTLHTWITFFTCKFNLYLILFNYHRFRFYRFRRGVRAVLERLAVRRVLKQNIIISKQTLPGNPIGQIMHGSLGWAS